MTTAPATDELNAAYNADVDKLDVAGKQLTEGNLGRLGATSAFEQEQIDMASVLADRQSNIGKLQALYGVGYDSDKYGALDSNILQGQFNDASAAATENLAARDSTLKAGDMVREQYGKQVADSKKITGDAKAVADKELGRLGGELSRLDVAIAERIRVEGDNKTTATKALEAQRDKIKKDYADKEKLLQASAKTNNEKVAADAAFKAKADAEHKKKKDLSAQLRNKYGVEINPITATEKEVKYWTDLYNRLERGDPGAIAEVAMPAYGIAKKTLHHVAPIAKGVVSGVKSLFKSSKDDRSAQERVDTQKKQDQADAELIAQAKRFAPSGGKSGGSGPQKFKIEVGKDGIRRAVPDYSK